MRGAISRNSQRFASARRSSFTGHHASRSGFPRGYYLADIPFGYADYAYDQPGPEPTPRVGSIERPEPEATPVPKAPPLLIELQGDRYVRYGGVAQTESNGSDRQVIATAAES